MPLPHRSKRKRSSNPKGENFSLQEVESLFSRHLLKIIGFLFLGVSLWFAANSADFVFKIYTELKTPSTLFSAPTGTPITHDTVEKVLPTPGTTTPVSGTVILIFSLVLVGWLGLQVLMRWRKRPEYQIVSVFVVFLSLLVLIRFYSWHVALLFSLLSILTIGYFFFSRHLSHTGTRLHFIFTWGLFLFWWLIKIMIQSNETLLPLFYVFGTLFFIEFLGIQLFHGFAGAKSLSRVYEFMAIMGNVILYFALMAFTILKFESPETLFFFTWGLTVLFFLTLWLMDRLKQRYRKQPFVLSFLLLCSLLLPFLFRTSQFILFTGSLSLLLMFYSRQTRDQWAILLSLGLTVLMMLWFIKNLALNYLPAAFNGTMVDNNLLFAKGLIAGTAVTLVLWTNRWIMKKVKVNLPRAWFSRRRYLRFMKGSFIVGLYFTLLFGVQYLCCQACPCIFVRFESWFSFHLLFCMVGITWLASQRASLLTPFLVTAVSFTLAYPTLLVFENFLVLDLFLRGDLNGIQLFPYHYIPSLLLLLFISVVLLHGQKCFRGNTWSKRFLLVYAAVMVLVVLINEMVLTVVALKAISPVDVMGWEDRLIQLPTSLLIVGESLCILGWGFVKRKRFARALALVMLVCTAGKIIYFDLQSISLINRIFLLFFTGVLFIGLSVFYNRMKKGSRSRRTHRATAESRPRKSNHPGVRE